MNTVSNKLILTCYSFEFTQQPDNASEAYSEMLNFTGRMSSSLCYRELDRDKSTLIYVGSVSYFLWFSFKISFVYAKARILFASFRTIHQFIFISHNFFNMVIPDERQILLNLKKKNQAKLHIFIHTTLPNKFFSLTIKTKLKLIILFNGGNP